MLNRPRGEIKFTPQSFIVQELVNVGNRKFPVPLIEKTDIQGQDPATEITVFHMTKIGWSTRQAIEEIARQLCVDVRHVSNYGLKDRHAYTSQCVGVEGKFNTTFEHDEIFLRQKNSTCRPLRPGGNLGNRFCVEVLTAARKVRCDDFKEVPNFFGLQRVSSRSDAEIGRQLIEGNFGRAAERMRHSPAFTTLVELFKASKDIKEAWLHPKMDFELKFNMLKWQSWLWNQLLQQAIDYGDLPDRLPMWTPESIDCYGHLWVPQQVDPDSLSRLHFFSRRTVVKPKNIDVLKTKLGWRVSFDLPSGAYATVTLSNVFELIEARR